MGMPNLRCHQGYVRKSIKGHKEKHKKSRVPITGILLFEFTYYTNSVVNKTAINNTIVNNTVVNNSAVNNRQKTSTFDDCLPVYFHVFQKVVYYSITFYHKISYQIASVLNFTYAPPFLVRKKSQTLLNILSVSLLYLFWVPL